MTLLEKAREMGLKTINLGEGEFAICCPEHHGIGPQYILGKECNEVRSCSECYAKEYDPDWDKNVVTAEVSPPDYKDRLVLSRSTILSLARDCVCGDREQDYGSPEDNFGTIAELWMAYLAAKFPSIHIALKDVAVMMCLVKIARISSGKAKADNWIDLAGYAACGGELEAQEAE